MTDNTVQGPWCASGSVPLAGTADEVAVTVAEIEREQRGGARSFRSPSPVTGLSLCPTYGQSDKAGQPELLSSLSDLTPGLHPTPSAPFVGWSLSDPVPSSCSIIYLPTCL